MADQAPTPATGGSGLAPNVASLLCYLCTWITGLVFILIEKENKQVKFHAWQALFFGISLIGVYIVQMIFAFIPYIGWIFSLVLQLGILGCWIFLMVKAYQGERFKLPIIGDLAEKQAGK